MAEQETQAKDAPPSEMFADAVCDGGTPVADCELCGRTHYVSSGYCMEQGELADLEWKHQQEPEKYIPSDCDSISIGHIDGRQVVYGCPCNKLSRYEKFIWRHRFLIAKYLKRRSEEMMAEAESEVENARTIPEGLLLDPLKPNHKRKFEL